jgi:predicted anti-sigma-YlaC factor YlaD
MTDEVTCDRLALALDDYLDGRDGVASHAAIDAHLADCAPCRAIVVDVGRLRRAARALGPIEPPAHVWPALQARLEKAHAGEAQPAETHFLAGRVDAWAWQPLAAAAMLALVVSSLTWLGGQLGSQPGDPPSSRSAAGSTAGDAGDSFAEFRLAEAQYTDAIARLQGVAGAADPGAIDGITSVTLQSSLDDIDSVIGEARAALAQEPGDELSQESLLDALGSKVAVLQDTVALLGDGDAAAAQAPEELNQ